MGKNKIITGVSLGMLVVGVVVLSRNEKVKEKLKDIAEIEEVKEGVSKLKRVAGKFKVNKK